MANTKETLEEQVRKLRMVTKQAIPHAHFYTRQVIAEVIAELEALAEEDHAASYSLPVCDRGRPGCIMEHDELKGESAHYPN